MAGAQARDLKQTLWPLLLLPVLSFCVVVPLLLHGPSCGHDFGFHLQSWMDAGAQIRLGHLLPRWAYSPAFNAGEPRFVFYPPISWLLGSGLLLLLPSAAVPAAFTWLALTGAALGMYFLALPFTTRQGAVLAATVYIGNPYLFFTAFERTAFAELLAAAWMPLLFRAAFAEQPSATAIALPLALLWLTNAPAAVMGTYALVVIVLIRAARSWAGARRTAQNMSKSRSVTLGRAALRAIAPMLGQAAGGLFLGLALAGFYLIPAALERRLVQIAMAIIPNMRVEDNFLFGHTGYGPHDAVLHTASLVALELAGATAVALLLAALRILRLRRSAQGAGQRFRIEASRRTALIPLLAVAGLVFLLLWHFTLPLWHLLPELVFLQFPWRLLAVLGCVLGLSLALALADLKLPLAATVLLAFGFIAAATALAYRPFRQGCSAEELPPARLDRFHTLHGVGPTDEYTPTDADNDQLRWDDPAWWLSSNPNAPGPNTVPNPAATILDYDQPPPMEQTISGRAPLYLRLRLAQPEDLILNLRDYPAWRVSLNGSVDPGHLQRDDGLLALALPAGDDTVDIRWQTLPDVWAGEALSLIAVIILGTLRLRSRRIEVKR